MLNICESCGQHSSLTAYDLTTQRELCPRCQNDLFKYLDARHKKESLHPKSSPTAA